MYQRRWSWPLVSLLCGGGKVPLLGTLKDGNASDKTINNELLTLLSERMHKLGLEPGSYVYIADSAMVTEDNLEQISDKIRFITRLPAV